MEQYNSIEFHAYYYIIAAPVLESQCDDQYVIGAIAINSIATLPLFPKAFDKTHAIEGFNFPKRLQ